MVALPTQAQAAARPAWHIVYTLPGGTATGLQDISAASKTDAWAFGVTYHGPHNSKDKAAYFHWNGRRWRQTSVSAPAGFFPSTVLDVAPGDVWMVGTVASLRESYPLALHLVGRTWRQLAIPYTPLGPVLVLSSGDIWIRGGGGYCTGKTPQVCTSQLLHWNGSAWSSYLVSGEITTLTGWGGHMWAAGLNDIRTKVVRRTRHGSVDQVTGRFTLLHFAGGKWAPAPTAHPTIASPGTGQFAAAGPGGRLWVVTAPARGRSTLRYFTGRHWSNHQVPADRSGLILDSGYVTYDYRYGIWAGANLRWSGGHWHSVPVTRGPAGNDIVDGIAAVPGSATVWGFGTDSDHSFIAEYQA